VLTFNVRALIDFALLLLDWSRGCINQCSLLSLLLFLRVLPEIFLKIHADVVRNQVGLDAGAIFNEENNNVLQGLRIATREIVSMYIH